jgi:hypothetical protein
MEAERKERIRALLPIRHRIAHREFLEYIVE